MNRTIFVALTLALLGLVPFSAKGTPAIAADFSWNQVAGDVSKHLDDMARQYRDGDVATAKRSIISAYFGTFEDRKMEAAMRKLLGKKHTFSVEKRFAQLRKSITKGVPHDDVDAMKDELIAVLHEDAAKLDDAGIPPEVYKVD